MDIFASFRRNSAHIVPLFGGVVAAAVVGLTFVNGYAGGVETAIGSDVSANELRAITVESFDTDYSGGGYGWELLTNRDSTKNGDPYSAEYSNVEVEREVKLVKGTPQDIRENQTFEEAKVLGIKYAFSFPGNNIVTIRPPRVDQYVVERPRPFFNDVALLDASKNDGKIKPHSCYKDPAKSELNRSQRGQFVDCIYGVELPGKVYQLSVWVAGRGNEYELEAWIEDWKGETHILSMGSLDFIGWRPMSVEIPVTVPQDVESFPQIKTIVLKQFKIRSTPKTSLEPVVVFFDEVRVLTDIFEVFFDGAQLDFDKADCERKNRILKVIRKHARYPEQYRAPVDCSQAPGPASSTGGSSGGGNTQTP